MAVATSSSRSKFVIKTRAHSDLFGLFNSVTCRDDAGVGKGKPAPDIFLEAHRKFHSPEQCLVIEDALRAARNAKI
ncbi:uncharacterized protein EI90DRAFT_3036404 [Cantharellus anzutake]|uniref:uncharacterized protein n=1 Tax=Cantharellus anzutake TaxID=1750568 RepID=UPI00190675C5|nr:uncharacterized protein EI90DRAFT_3036404 [Cantharellus anzutake]KAF8340666.1 hypothetical protein EI90DRAFT_3036404 [Cantharellus anzutake]